eukprot:TRINITY_DN6153_c0_g1_i4.p1 TRINITY_DN6153_c0_g1~~TRINITY_DN6153_c0_g1_i4.p1  ORF type:complete len:385 (-),score=36.44 TRINITY_DN6153_c0_g1_i4:280-1434(-)
MPDILQTNPFITTMHSTTKLAREKYHTLSTKSRTKKQQTLMFSCNDCEESFATRWQLSHHTKESDGHSNPIAGGGQLLKIKFSYKDPSGNVQSIHKNLHPNTYINPQKEASPEQAVCSEYIHDSDPHENLHSSELSEHPNEPSPEFSDQDYGCNLSDDWSRDGQNSLPIESNDNSIDQSISPIKGPESCNPSQKRAFNTPLKERWIVRRTYPKPFTCSACAKAFWMKKSLLKHKLTEHFQRERPSTTGNPNTENNTVISPLRVSAQVKGKVASRDYEVSIDELLDSDEENSSSSDVLSSPRGAPLPSKQNGTGINSIYESNGKQKCDVTVSEEGGYRYLCPVENCRVEMAHNELKDGSAALHIVKDHQVFPSRIIKQGLKWRRL